MCGIAGFIGEGEKEIGEKMIQSIKHRGPDGQATVFQNGVCFAHARLSIIDVSEGGNQPMWSADGTVLLVFNGEIYNFQEHRARLVKEGYDFKGHSDTEVILALYNERGEDGFALLDGMFAFALYDFTAQKCFLVRDRMGKKPLYYSLFGETLVFASELKALLAHPAVTKELSEEALSLYLTHEYVPTPLTIFKNIYKLEPATVLKYESNTIQKKQFWQPEFLKHDSVVISEEEAVRELDKRISASVRERLVSDVPLGVFLSGGLDSSLVAQYSSEELKKQKGERLHTYSIGFEDASFDESVYAEKVAKHIDSIHHTKVFSAEDALALLPEIAKNMDEPFADASILPTYMLAKFARKDITVALGGDGSDEIFLGYSTFVAAKLAQNYQKLPVVIQNMVARIVSFLPTSHKYMSFDFKAKRFVRGAQASPIERNQLWMGAFSPEEVQKLLSPYLVGKLRQYDSLVIDKKYWSEITGDDLRHQSWLYARTYMMDGVMVKADRASMLASLELRSPLLATKVVEYAYMLPTKLKLKGGEVKYILKKLMEKKLPLDILYRKKKGFGVPIGEWLRGPLLPLVKEKLSREKVAAQGIFTPAYVDKLVLEHESGKKDNRKELWTLLMFQLWYGNYYE